MKAFSQFVGEAYAVLGGTRFERRTPTSSELKAAQDARAATQGTFRQKEMAAIKASVKPPAPTPAAAVTPAAAPAPKPSALSQRVAGYRAGGPPMGPREKALNPISRNTSSISPAQPTEQPKPSSEPDPPQPKTVDQNKSDIQRILRMFRAFKGL